MALDDLIPDILAYKNFLVETAMNQASVAAMGKLCNDIARYYRAIGICSLLILADSHAFFYGLIRSALTRKYYLDRCVKENLLSHPERRTSVIDPFLDAVAANQFTLACQIASLSPDQWWEGYEYEDDFAYAYFLHRFIQFDESEPKELQAIIGQFEKALEGETDTRLDLCKALLAREQDEFDGSFSQLLNDHEERTKKITNPELDSRLATEHTFEPNRWIFVEGLAILKIAEKMGIQTEEEYKFCPSIARRTDIKPFVADSFPYLEWQVE